MKPKDSDTFIDIGVSITRLLLMASGQGTAASLIGEGAGLLRNLRSGGQRAISAEKIAADVAARLPRESWDISEADWHAAATHVAPLIDRLSEKDRLAAGYDWTALRPMLLDLGGEERRRKLADESARRAFNLVLDVACQRITDCFTQEEALASLLKKVNEDCARLQRIERLLDRPGVQETRVVINDHIEVLRHLAPDTLVDREQELADLEAFVRNSDGVWYAMEADMVSGKTAVMASFALNPPDDVHMASFFIRRIGGDRNDRGSFAFVMGAQLAKILGHEYTEPVRDPAQHTEFRQLLRRAATACRSETTPRPLVLLIDGIDEDSYFENPDGADAKSILSLLPRRLPEGVKIITASRPNPRLPEDVLCDENRRIVSLKPSPIAEKSINRKDMKIFFKSDVAVDIGAFLAACGGVLTVEDLRTLLIMRGHQRTLTWDVRAYVNRSPGRILTLIDVGFSGQEVLAYRLGHDVVTRAVIRELDPDSFGEGDEPEDERWWAPIREKTLAPYRAIIRDWVKKCANGGWGDSTPSYVLSGACFDLMFNDKRDDGSSVRVVLDRGRYNEMRRRSGRRSHVLRMIDRECFTILDMNRGELPESATTSIFEVAESRKLLVQASTYIPGLPKLYVSYFNIAPEAALDMIMAVDDPKDRLDALRETMKAAIGSERGCAFLTIFLDAIRSLVLYRNIRNEVLRLLVDILVFIDNTASNSKTSDNVGVDLGGWLNEVLISTKIEDLLPQLPFSLEGVDGSSGNAHTISPFLLIAEYVAERIEESLARAWALAGVSGALARAGDAEGARRVAEEAVSAAERIGWPWGRARALAGVSGALARAGLTGEALAAVERIEDPGERARALADVADALARAGDTEGARRVAEEAVSAAEQIQIEDPRARARALTGAAGALARAGDAEGVRRVAEEAVSAAEQIQIEDPRARVLALVEVAGALARAGAIDEAREIVTMINEPSSRSRAQSAVIKALVRKGSSNEAVNILHTAIAEVEGFVLRQDAADYCATLAAACVDAADILADSADAEPAERDRWLGLARSALARSWLYGAPVWNRFDVLLRVAPDLATRLVEERLLAEPESANPASSVDPASPEALEGPEGPGGGTPSSS